MAYIFELMKVGAPRKGLLFYLLIVFSSSELRKELKELTGMQVERKGKRFLKETASCSQKSLWGEMAGRHGDRNLNK